jgi:hypothetical protein
MSTWESVLELGSDRSLIGGSQQALGDAIRRGADLRIYTEFRHNEHLDPASDNAEIVQEVSDFRVTYLVDDRWTAGIMSQRMPIAGETGFGPRASMSFFMYNQDGQQAIARPYLDGIPATGTPWPSPPADHGDMPKYHEQDRCDDETNAPSSNFIYDFEVYRFLVRDVWHEVYAHSAEGEPVSGSLDALTGAFASGCDVKVAVRGLCNDLVEDPTSAIDHEVLVECGPGYYSTERRVFFAGSQPVVRVTTGIPMRYQCQGWDFGWLMLRADGFVARWLCDPYSLKFDKSQTRHAIRWFVR